MTTSLFLTNSLTLTSLLLLVLSSIELAKATPIVSPPLEYGCDKECCRDQCDYQNVETYESCLATIEYTCDLWVTRDLRMSSEILMCGDTDLDKFLAPRMGQLGLNMYDLLEGNHRISGPLAMKGTRTYSTNVNDDCLDQPWRFHWRPSTVAACPIKDFPTNSIAAAGWWDLETLYIDIKPDENVPDLSQPTLLLMIDPPADGTPTKFRYCRVEADPENFEVTVPIIETVYGTRRSPIPNVSSTVASASPAVAERECASARAAVMNVLLAFLVVVSSA